MAGLIQPTRRGFLAGLGALLAAPAIARASSLMPVRSMSVEAPQAFLAWDYSQRPDYTSVAVKITGVDAYGSPMTEIIKVLPDGTWATGEKIFASVSSATGEVTPHLSPVSVQYRTIHREGRRIQPGTMWETNLRGVMIY